ncbi:MAG: PIG-L family deacetylase [Pseudomonadota bacterium]
MTRISRWLPASTALALLCNISASAKADADSKSITEADTVLAIFAHPDDELIVAPALARLARQGAEVHILYATRGDLSAPQTDLPPGEEIAALRSDEARCASQALGLSDAMLLDFGDGTLGQRTRPNNRILGSLADQIRAQIDDFHPDLVISWGPEGGYGHPDHRLISAVVTEVVQSMGNDRPQLLYPGIANGSIPDIPEAKVIPWITTDPALLTISIAYDETDLAASRAAFPCHKSQYVNTLLIQGADLFHQTIWQGAVHFRPAFAPAAENSGRD